MSSYFLLTPYVFGIFFWLRQTFVGSHEVSCDCLQEEGMLSFSSEILSVDDRVIPGISLLLQISRFSGNCTKLLMAKNPDNNKVSFRVFSPSNNDDGVSSGPLVLHTCSSYLFSILALHTYSTSCILHPLCICILFPSRKRRGHIRLFMNILLKKHQEAKVPQSCAQVGAPKNVSLFHSHRKEKANLIL